MRLALLIAPLAAALLAACGDTVDDDRVPYAPVHVDLGAQGLWDVYGVHGYSQYNIFIRTGSSATSQPPNFSYPDLAATGYGGLLLVANLENYPLVYDLACPVERKQTVRVNYDRDTQLATCPECGSQFNVCEHYGSPISGLAYQHKWGLTRYNARASSLGGYVLTN